ncbi:unnamed protein product [Penicillium nalgiovense]|uniref:Major facilitator superfamily (MFS) profile domain-containing protein n=1 Tax=Penicillium nalgiovense TaxID=60175 RepID=A0A9W4MX37_PENNA|nr:unnamed protein product [Penicillium nalgiovense]CAG7976831.1 unnamed protein product [Penicillium nalgiovense]CAG7977773.1 unnamed protein product [Penicillium nalgiovense]CAG8033061.1 unnamed protein product [Penicillium nalgiovense]CAG8049741.1 unnamed protein product [Penicillium nalgiovense]
MAQLPLDIPEEPEKASSNSETRSTEQQLEKGTAHQVPSAVSTEGIDEPAGTKYPEGGWGAWGVVLGSWMALFGSMSFMNSIGTFQTYLLRNQLSNYSPEAVGWIFGVYNGLTFLLGIQAGPIFDARGPRELICCGGTLTIIYLMLLGICTEYWHFMLVYGVLGGISLSLIFGPAIAIVAHYFNARRGFATGIASSGGAVGGVVFPLMLQKLFDSAGFAWATRTAGFVCIVTFILAGILIRPRFPPKSLTLSTVRPDLTIFRQGGLALTSLGVFFLEWGLFIPFTYLTSYAIDHGSSAAFSYMLLSLINAAGVFGRWVPGFYADRLGRFNMLILTVLGCLLSILCLWLPTKSSEPMMVVFALVFGFFGGSNVSLAPVCIGQLCKIESFGRYYSTAYILVSISMFTGTALGGKFIEVCNGEYHGVIAFAAASYLASFICLVRAKTLCWGKSNIWSKF